MRWLAVLIVILAHAFAFPRLGVHEGYTRLVFDLGKTATYKLSESDGTLTIRFGGLRPKAADEDIGSPQVASYQVVPGGAGAVAYVRLRQGVDVKTVLFDDAGGRRLVVDVVTVASGGRPTGARQDTGPVVAPRPASTVRTVVLDAGHGGIDSGAVCFVTEKRVTLDLAQRVRALLTAQGIKVVMTRNSDGHLSADKTTDLSRRASLADSRKNLFVSIHVNSTAGCPGVGGAQGIETYYFGNTIDPRLLAQVIRENGGGSLGQALTRQAQGTAQRLVSDLLAQANLSFSQRLASYVQSSLVRSTGAVNRGVRQAPFYVIRNARIPAILIEVGFGNHPVEGRKLATEEYRQTLAKAIAGGITRFLGNGSGG